MILIKTLQYGLMVARVTLKWQFYHAVKINIVYSQVWSAVNRYFVPYSWTTGSVKTSNYNIKKSSVEPYRKSPAFIF